MKKLKEIDGWIEDDKRPETGLPKKCPECGSAVWVTNALHLIGVILVGCKNSKCRWCEEYTDQTLRVK